MSYIESLPHISHFSGADKIQIMQFLREELAKQEGIVMGNEAAKIMVSVDTYNRAAEQVMQLLEIEHKHTQNV